MSDQSRTAVPVGDSTLSGRVFVMNFPVNRLNTRCLTTRLEKILESVRNGNTALYSVKVNRNHPLVQSLLNEPAILTTGVEGEDLLAPLASRNNMILLFTNNPDSYRLYELMEPVSLADCQLPK